jgi:hypothetical protein
MIAIALAFVGGFAYGTFVTWWTFEIEPEDSAGPG